MNETLKKALVSILVAAVIAFITTLLQGLLEVVKQTEWNTSGAVVGTLYFLTKNAKA